MFELGETATCLDCHAPITYRVVDDGDSAWQAADGSTGCVKWNGELWPHEAQ